MELIHTARFKADLEFYLVKRGYKKIIDDLDPALYEIGQGRFPGSKLENRSFNGVDVYKVGTANSSADTGKSGGFRVLYYPVNNDKVYLLTVYSKKDAENIPADSQVQYWAEGILK